MELMGIPHRIVVSDRGLENNELEYKSRRAENAETVPLASVLEFLRARIAK
jgi:prolyl-tRNA synthetase